MLVRKKSGNLLYAPRISWPLWMEYTQKVRVKDKIYTRNISAYMESRSQSVGFGPMTKLFCWCFWCPSILYQVLYVLVQLCPVNITPHQTFHPWNNWMPNMEFFEDSFLESYRYYNSFAIFSILLQIEFTFFSWFCCFIRFIKSFMNLSSDTFLWISSRVTGSSRIALHRVFMISICC